MVKTYDPKQMIVTFGGVQLSGFADGTFVSIVPNDQAFAKTVGADGEVVRAKTNDYTYEVSITLLRTSDSNDYLSGIHITDKLTSKGALPLTITDLNGNTVFFVESAWIRQLPDAEDGKEIGERTWIFDTVQADEYIVGGNTPVE